MTIWPNLSFFSHLRYSYQSGLCNHDHYLLLSYSKIPVSASELELPSLSMLKPSTRVPLNATQNCVSSTFPSFSTAAQRADFFRSCSYSNRKMLKYAFDKVLISCDPSIWGYCLVSWGKVIFAHRIAALNCVFEQFLKIIFRFLILISLVEYLN